MANFRQGAAEVVDAPAQALGGGVEAHLDPGRLQRRDRPAEREPEDRPCAAASRASGGALRRAIRLSSDCFDIFNQIKKRTGKDYSYLCVKFLYRLFRQWLK